ncbi:MULTISPECIES: hypothetical protein [unclassified Frankia]|uniref:hypothetical protein n=1 Tax=unclassified Frankia TaxID=2632575 RepID=UPI000402522F|nr:MULTISPECIES: hypothetical protein [unclassified Frankia]OHV48603.1 hypothetical protein CgIS1_06265 [Frankia sp. CgIS1]
MDAGETIDAGETMGAMGVAAGLPAVGTTELPRCGPTMVRARDCLPAADEVGEVGEAIRGSSTDN